MGVGRVVCIPIAEDQIVLTEEDTLQVAAIKLLPEATANRPS